MTVKVCQCNGSACSCEDDMTEEERKNLKEIMERYKYILVQMSKTE